MNDALESIREYLKEVKTRRSMDYMPAKRKNCSVELTERVAYSCEECKVEAVLLGRRVPVKAK